MAEVRRLTVAQAGLPMTLACDLADAIDDELDPDEREDVLDAVLRAFDGDDAEEGALHVLEALARTGGARERETLARLLLAIVGCHPLDPEGVVAPLARLLVLAETQGPERVEVRRIVSSALRLSLKTGRCDDAETCQDRLRAMIQLVGEDEAAADPVLRDDLTRALMGSIHSTLCRDAAQADWRLERLRRALSESDPDDPARVALPARALCNLLEAELCDEADAARRLTELRELAAGSRAAHPSYARSLGRMILQSEGDDRAIEEALNELERIAVETPTLDNLVCAAYSLAARKAGDPLRAGRWAQRAQRWYDPDATVARRGSVPGLDPVDLEEVEVENASARLGLHFGQAAPKGEAGLEKRQVEPIGIEDETAISLADLDGCTSWIRARTERGLGLSVALAARLDVLLGEIERGKTERGESEDVDRLTRLALARALERSAATETETDEVETGEIETGEVEIVEIVEIADLLARLVALGADRDGGEEERGLLSRTLAHSVAAPDLTPEETEMRLARLAAYVESNPTSGENEARFLAIALVNSLSSDRCEGDEQAEGRLDRLETLARDWPGLLSRYRRGILMSIQPALCRGSDAATERLERLERTAEGGDAEWWYLQAVAFFASIRPELCQDAAEAERRFSLLVQLAGGLTAARLPYARALVASLSPELCPEHRIQPRLAEVERLAGSTPTFGHVACAAYARAATLTRDPAHARAWLRSAEAWYDPDLGPESRRMAHGIAPEGYEDGILREHDAAIESLEEAREAIATLDDGAAPSADVASAERSSGHDLAAVRVELQRAAFDGEVTQELLRALAQRCDVENEDESRRELARELERTIAINQGDLRPALDALAWLADLGGPEERSLLAAAWRHASHPPGAARVAKAIQQLGALMESGTPEIRARARAAYADSLVRSIDETNCPDPIVAQSRLDEAQRFHDAGELAASDLAAAYAGSLLPSLCLTPEQAEDRLVRMETLLDGTSTIAYLVSTGLRNSLSPELCSGSEQATGRLARLASLAGNEPTARHPYAVGLIRAGQPEIKGDDGDTESRLTALIELASITPTLENLVALGLASAAIHADSPARGRAWYNAALSWLDTDEIDRAPGEFGTGESDWGSEELALALSTIQVAAELYDPEASRPDFEE